MANVINLRTARKARDRKVRATKADANRVAFGRTKAERVAADAERLRTEKALDGAKCKD